MANSRSFTLDIEQGTLQLPCFFPSISSIKTSLLPVDYIELLDAVAYPYFLISAYDIANSSPEHHLRIDEALNRSKNRGAVVLMDCGNYEGFWKGDSAWVVDKFDEIV